MINRKTPKEDIEKMLKNRDISIDLDNLYKQIELENKLQKELEILRKQSNIAAEERKIDLGKELKIEIHQKELELNQLKDKNYEMLVKIPNLLDNSVPFGLSEDDNVEIKRKGEIIFSKHHYEMDIFESCTDFTGSRFVILKDKIAKLERAIYCFMMDFLSKKGFIEFSVPYLLNSSGLEGSGHLPKDKDNMFKIENEDKYLIPTGEPVLVNLGRDKRWDETKRFCTLTDCFRKEAGSAGKDMKGLIRLHQFKKCEMVCFSQPENSNEILEEMLRNSCEILDLLEIPWRILLLCSKDTPLTSFKTYDIEVPICNQWREIASISNCTDYQSSNINCKNSQKEFLHILNGSALAVGRTLASILEINYKNGKVSIPKILSKWIDFSEIIV